jgi:hypothetical protein
VREEELAARSVAVDAEREELELLGYGEGRESERVVRSGLAVDTGGVRGRSSPTGRDTVRRGAGDAAGVGTARRPASFDDAERGC